jgi:PAS domain-containing protein
MGQVRDELRNRPIKDGEDMRNGTYKKVLDGMPEGVFVFDNKLRVQFTNAAFRRSCSDGALPKGELKKEPFY